MSLPDATSPAEKVELRPAEPHDAVFLDRWRREPSVRQFQPLGTASLNQLRAELGRQRIPGLYSAEGDKFQWIIQLESRPAGWITLLVTNWEHGLAEIGYALSTPFQGRAIMSRALIILLDDLFRRTRIERVEARCAVDNSASQRVLERVGFQREGRLRGYFVLRGRRVDNYLYAILGSDFLSPAIGSSRAGA